MLRLRADFRVLERENERLRGRVLALERGNYRWLFDHFAT
jgi:hypothetical protein